MRSPLVPGAARATPLAKRRFRGRRRGWVVRSLPPLEKGRIGEGIALHIERPLFVARDPLPTSPFQGEEVHQSERNMLEEDHASLARAHFAAALRRAMVVGKGGAMILRPRRM